MKLDRDGGKFFVISSIINAAVGKFFQQTNADCIKQKYVVNLLTCWVDELLKGFFLKTQCTFFGALTIRKCAIFHIPTNVENYLCFISMNLQKTETVPYVEI